MADLPIDFKELLEAFDSERVDAVVVGGYAVAFHGRPRATKDIDLVLAGGAENLAAAARALEWFGAPANVVHAVSTLNPSEIAFMGQPPLRIDLLGGIEGVPTAGLFERAIHTTIDGVAVRVISLDDLITKQGSQYVG